jgi:hypothetical protein
MKLEDQGIYINAKSNTFNKSTQSICTSNKDASTKASSLNKAIELKPDFADAYIKRTLHKGINL